MHQGLKCRVKRLKIKECIEPNLKETFSICNRLQKLVTTKEKKNTILKRREKLQVKYHITILSCMDKSLAKFLFCAYHSNVPIHEGLSEKGTTTETKETPSFYTPINNITNA